MPIPQLDSNGLLPPGVHDCTLDEIGNTFGRFARSDRRIHLTRRLKEYLADVSAAGIGKWLYVDGSYVTDKDEPGDIDLLLILKDDVRLDQEVPPFEYNVRTKKFIKRHFGFDFFFGFENDPSAQSILALFCRVKGVPEAEKGILRVAL